MLLRKVQNVMSKNKYTVQLTRMRECTADEVIIFADSEEEAKKEYLKMIDEGELELCECATDDDWYCEEEE